jgi:hypothetical protein
MGVDGSYQAPTLFLCEFNQIFVAFLYRLIRGPDFNKKIFFAENGYKLFKSARAPSMSPLMIFEGHFSAMHRLKR